MENITKNQTLTKVLIALIVVLLTAPALFAQANPEKKTEPFRSAKKTKQAKLTKEKINNILDRIEQNQPERAKQLRKLRKKDPEKFRTELREIMQKWASKKDRKPKSSARRGKSKGKNFAHDKFKGPYRNRRWTQSQYCPFAQAEAVASCCSQFRGRQHRRRMMFHDDYQPGPRRGQGRGGRGQGFRGKGQGFRGRGRHQEMGFGHGRRGRGQGLRDRGRGRRQEMSFGHGRRGRGRRGRGQGRRFNRGQGYDRPEHGYGYNREHQRTGPYIDWDE